MRVLAVIGVVLLLAGCVQTGPEDASTPAPSVTPVFSSEEEALAAAEEAYAAYVRLADQIGQQGGAEPQRLLTVMTAAAAASEIESFERFSTAGWRSVGNTTFDRFTLQAFEPTSLAGVVSVYVCSDVSNVDVIDATGSSVVSPDRPSRTAFTVEFDAVRSDAALVISSKSVWDGAGVCD